ncbi:MAG: iron-sulfur cluster assembly scaffold protein NifU [Myxococcales bacterium]
MSMDLRDLYQEVILDHNRRPRNFHAMDGSTGHAVGHNPLCGDQVTVWVAVRDGLVTDVSFQGSGCAISTASASVMTEVLRGKSVAEAERLYHVFHELVTDGAEVTEDLGKLAVFAGVGQYPARVKCASLAWHTVHAALTGEAETISTE